MRKQLFTLAFAAMALLFTTGLTAQVTMPSASPTVKVETKIGLTDFHVTYSRPGMKGREIFAEKGLVPYGEIWRTGANQATKFTFTDKVMVGGAELAAGDYAILTKPMAGKWEVMLFPYESGSWNSYVEKTPAATVSAKSMATGSPVETFTIDVQNYTMDGADIVMSWGNTMAVLPVTTNAKEAVMGQIDRMMAGPSQNDYYQAATFLSESGGKEKMKDALTYIQKANKMAGDDQRYWMVRREGIILESMGMKKEAKAAFTKSLELAKAAGNMDYVRLNEKSLMMKPE
ncbi:DUF2911 domain-containing protein [Neolewinella persica]|uniref:DUF2911 domain-containing protein n=1 Tax=Neolewinella persica TaxID=70998 RepID=UPI00037F92CA|nr:DUF2911 domain-containing protein [Neolewinella persica]